MASGLVLPGKQSSRLSAGIIRHQSCWLSSWQQSFPYRLKPYLVLRMNKSHLHIFVGLILSFFLLTLADLVPFWMPMMGELVALLLVVVLLLIWAGFVMQEQTNDEREIVLKMKAGRVAYLSGMFVLMIGLIVQGMAEAIDPWIAVALAVMVLAKLATRYFCD